MRLTKYGCDPRQVRFKMWDILRDHVAGHWTTRTDMEEFHECDALPGARVRGLFSDEPCNRWADRCKPITDDPSPETLPIAAVLARYF